MTPSILQPLSDDYIKLEASRQISKDVEVEKVHISLVRCSDTVFHEGRVRTVGNKDLNSDAFMGPTMFGDSYVLGRKPVHRLIMRRALSHGHSVPAAS